MKHNPIPSEAEMKTLITSMMLLSLAVEVSAQSPVHWRDSEPSQSDMITVGTGFPYLLSVEYSMQLFDKYRGGLILTKIPGGEGIGLRFDGTIYDNGGNPRLLLQAPVFYYPTNRIAFCGKPWLFAWPSVNAEWRTGQGTSFTLGSGLASAACLHFLLGHHSEEGEEEENQSMSGTWYTLKGGMSLQVMRKSVLTVELSAVMSGFKLAQWNEWVARIPLMVVIGVSLPLE
jgi:hypothetical protein